MTVAAMLTKQQERLAKKETDDVSKGREDVVAADDYHPGPQPPLSGPQAQAGKKAYSTAGIQKLIHGDCLYWMRTIRDNSIDLIATDSPYGINYLRNAWDHDLPRIEIWRECFRVLKPGAFLTCMMTPRGDRSSSMYAMLKRAGFKIDLSPIYWIYAQGNPPSRGITKGIRSRREKCGVAPEMIDSQTKAFEGWHGGFNPKPAVELVIVAQKPIAEKTNIDQAMKNGHGISNVKACLIPYAKDEPIPTRDYTKQRSYGSKHVRPQRADGYKGDLLGRWPANVLVSDDMLGNYYSKYFSLDAWSECNFPFLVVPKPKGKGKNFGLVGIKNDHDTVKPIPLFLYLLSMFSGEGAIILDPMMGSGTSMIAAKLLGRQFVGMEQDAHSFEIARQRVDAATPTIPYYRKMLAKAKMPAVKPIRSSAQQSVNSVQADDETPHAEAA